MITSSLYLLLSWTKVFTLILSDILLVSSTFIFTFAFYYNEQLLECLSQSLRSFRQPGLSILGVVMVEMMEKMGMMAKEIKRLRHHVSVLSNRNNEMMKKGESRAASSIASDASLSSDDVELESELGVEGLVPRQRVVSTLVEEEGRRKMHGDGVSAP